MCGMGKRGRAKLRGLRKVASGDIFGVVDGEVWLLRRESVWCEFEFLSVRGEPGAVFDSF